jgi:hypothetical protein
MDMATKIKICACTLAMSASFAGGWFSHQPKTITVTEIKTVEKFVDRVVEVEKRVSDHSVTKTEIKKANGDTITSVTQANVSVEAETSSKTVEKTKETQTTAVQPSVQSRANYVLGISARFDSTSFPVPKYQIDAGWRLFGPFWLTSIAGQDLSGAVGLRIEF